MCTAIIGTLLQMVGASSAADDDKAAAGYDAAVSEQNAAISDQTAADVTAKGHSDEEQYLRKVAQLQGTQRATIAANNIDASSGSALDIQAQTAAAGAADASRIRSNALREAWGYKVEAQNYRNDAAFERTTGKLRAHTRILTAYGNAASTLGDAYNKTGGFGFGDSAPSGGNSSAPTDSGGWGL